MQFGINFPTGQIGLDPIAMRDFAQATEGAGFDYLSTYEHVAGAHPDRLEGVQAAYFFEDQFHEPLTMFAFMAAITEQLQFATSVLVLAQRQTVLVAKQAAEIDLLSGGRLRLGVGIGWNHTEYEALGQDFNNRGRRVEEQIEVLRLLWGKPLVTFSGRWHTLDRVGINPLPGRQIPVWIGGGDSDAVLRRVAKVADGWIPFLSSDKARETVDRLRAFLLEAGRDPQTFPIESSLGGTSNDKELIEKASTLQSLGVTYLQISFANRDTTAAQALESSIKAKQLIQAELAASA